MKKIILSRHVDTTDADGKPITIYAGEHTLPASVVSKLETAAKNDPRTKVTILEDLTPKESREVSKNEAAKAEADKGGK